MRTVTLEEIRTNGFSLSPAHYSEFHVTTPAAKPVRELLDPERPYDAGTEPGSDAYVRASTTFLMRTKALQAHSWLVYPKGDAIVPLNPRAFIDQRLKEGDIVLSKDSNVGEVALIDRDRARGHVRSGGVLKLNPVIDSYYLFAFLKHPSFKTELEGQTPRGATIRHAGELWLDCRIALPNQRDADRIVVYVSQLAQCIATKERLIRERSREISQLIERELDRGRRQHPRPFQMPSIAEIRARGRFDAAIYDRRYKDTIALIESYEHGSETPSEAGFVVNPGPSLELKIIKTRADSDEPRPGFYSLILPKNLSEYGTINRVQYLGTAKKLPLLHTGDVVLGEAGFHKGRSVVLIDAPPKCTTNAHGIYARHVAGDIPKAIVFRCIFNWYRERGLVDLIAVGGSGGHLSPSYFDTYIKLPRFPAKIASRIVSLYSGGVPRESLPASGPNLVARHAERNKQLGLWQLDRERELLLDVLYELQAVILRGDEVRIRGSEHNCATSNAKR